MRMNNNKKKKRVCGESVEDTRYQHGYLWMKIAFVGGKSGASPLVKRQKIFYSPNVIQNYVLAFKSMVNFVSLLKDCIKIIKGE